MELMLTINTPKNQAQAGLKMVNTHLRFANRDVKFYGTEVVTDNRIVMYCSVPEKRLAYFTKRCALLEVKIKESYRLLLKLHPKATDLKEIQEYIDKDIVQIITA